MSLLNDAIFPFIRLTKIGAIHLRHPAQRRVTGPPLLPDGYWVTGWLLRPITVGEPIQMLRVNRNGVQCVGIFLSSPVARVEGASIWTDNSRYSCVIPDDQGDSCELVAPVTFNEFA